MSTKKTRKTRVHVTIPRDVASLLDWYVAHDPRFKGNRAMAVVHFFAEGIRAAYEAGLRCAGDD